MARLTEKDLQMMLGKKRAQEILDPIKRGYFTKPKSSKYSNQKTTVDGVRYDSKLEAKNHQELILRERIGEITHLRRQVRFPLRVRGQLVCNYVADHVWVEDGRMVVADSKGMKTDIYRLKKKLMKAVYGIEVIEL